MILFQSGIVLASPCGDIIDTTNIPEANNQKRLLISQIEDARAKAVEVTFEFGDLIIETLADGSLRLSIKTSPINTKRLINKTFRVVDLQFSPFDKSTHQEWSETKIFIANDHVIHRFISFTTPEGEAIGRSPMREIVDIPRLQDGLDIRRLSREDLLFGYRVAESSPGSDAEPFRLTTEEIKNIVEIDNTSIADLERVMRAKPPMTGYLKASESLIEVLVRDDMAVKALNMTHETVSEPLLAIIKILTNIPRYWGKDSSLEIVYNGQPISIVSTTWMGSLWSPFNIGSDLLGSNLQIELVNLLTGKKLSFHGVTPDLIYAYGFYQAPSNNFRSFYRLEPKDIVDFFNLQSKTSIAH